LIAVPHRPLDAKVMLFGIRFVRRLGRLLGMRRPLLSFEVALTQHLGLFDKEHYLGQIQQDELRGMSPLRHYVAHGDAVGLSPSPLFDTRYYDAQFTRPHGVNRLLHYGLVARFRGASPTPWFDVEYYTQSNPDVAHSRIDALLHFQRWGWREGRSPLPGLDLHRVLSMQPAVRVAKSNPLGLLVDVHPSDLRRRSGIQGSSAKPTVADRDLLDPAKWSAIEPRRYPVDPKIDVVIPVYAGTQETLHCLWSVLTAPVVTPHEVIVINDAGPAPELNAMLRLLANRGLFRLEQHRQNLGFVKTANHGMRLHKERDVVLLNSDTEVYHNWLDRLAACAAENPRVATITPLSNNATICSYPETNRDNRGMLEISHADVDQLAARANRDKHVATPTGVGFCMYMRRDAVREVGLFDERRFGRGYGEENDFCQRAQRRGWKNVIACDVYVRHVGSVSFKAEAGERVAKALKTLRRLHPEYQSQVDAHIAGDPAWIHRARIDLERLKRERRSRNVLMVCHNRGGGTERHLLEQAQALLADGVGVFELRPSRHADRVALVHPGLYGLNNIAAIPLDHPEFLEEALRELAIAEVHVHHLIDLPPGIGGALQRLCGKIGMMLRMSVHDYFAICPRVNLVTPEGHHCVNPTPADCNACLSRDGLIDQVGPIEPWRQARVGLLRSAGEVVVPSQDVAARLERFLPGKAIRIQPHEDTPAAPALVLPPLGEGEPLRLLVVGAISRIKGYEVVLSLAETVRSQALPLQISLLGYSANDTRLSSLGVTLLGRYFDNDLLERIEANNPHIVLIPSIWPETYCYVLSGAMRSGRRIAVFDLGAQAERVRAHHASHIVMPLELAAQPRALSELLLDTAARHAESGLRVAA
jgi:O-antigen biosynthesis protein